MSHYELTYLIPATSEENKIQNTQEKINSLISKAGQILKVEKLKRISLAYPIKKTQEAFLGTVEFTAPSQKVEDLKKKLEKEIDILRFLLIKKGGIKKVSEMKKETLITKEKVPKRELKKEINEQLEKILDK